MLSLVVIFCLVNASSAKKLSQQEKAPGIYVSFLILVTTVTTGGGVLFFQAGVLFSIENAKVGRLFKVNSEFA